MEFWHYEEVRARARRGEECARARARGEENCTRARTRGEEPEQEEGEECGQEEKERARPRGEECARARARGEEFARGKRKRQQEERGRGERVRGEGVRGEGVRGEECAHKRTRRERCVGSERQEEGQSEEGGPAMSAQEEWLARGGECSQEEGLSGTQEHGSPSYASLSSKNFTRITCELQIGRENSGTGVREEENSGTGVPEDRPARGENSLFSENFSRRECEGKIEFLTPNSCRMLLEDQADLCLNMLLNLNDECRKVIIIKLVSNLEVRTSIKEVQSSIPIIKATFNKSPVKWEDSTPPYAVDHRAFRNHIRGRNIGLPRDPDPNVRRIGEQRRPDL